MVRSDATGVRRSAWGDQVSAFGAGVGKAVGGLGGPQVAAIVIAGGLVAGAIGGGIVAGGGSDQGATSSATLSIHPCPEAGPALATVPSGQQFLVTGKNDDATWVRIYYPLPGRTEAWVTAGPLQFDGSLGDGPGRALLAGRGRPRGLGRAGRVADRDPGQQPVAVRRLGRPTASPDGGPTLARLSSGRRSRAGRSATASARLARSRSASARPIGLASRRSPCHTGSPGRRTSPPRPCRRSAGPTPGARPSPPIPTASPARAASASTSRRRTRTPRRNTPRTPARSIGVAGVRQRWPRPGVPAGGAGERVHEPGRLPEERDVHGDHA